MREREDDTVDENEWLDRPRHKAIPYQAYPKMLFKGDDHSKPENQRIVADEAEHKAAEVEGFKAADDKPAPKAKA